MSQKGDFWYSSLLFYDGIFNVTYRSFFFISMDFNVSGVLKIEERLNPYF
jgi:hypothetical protein